MPDRRFTSVSVATAMLEGQVSNSRLQELCSDHSRDLTTLLQRMVGDRLLEAHGIGRGTWYTIEEGEGTAATLQQSARTLQHSEGWKGQQETVFEGVMANVAGSGESEPTPQHLANEKELMTISAAVRNGRKARRDLNCDTIIKFCSGRFLTTRELAQFLDRNPTYLRNQFIGKLIKEGLLDLEYPDEFSHPNQAYRTRDQT